MEILIHLLGIACFGGMGLLLVQAGRKRLKNLNNQETYGLLASIRGLAAIFQIGVGCLGILFAINQIVLVIIKFV